MYKLICLALAVHQCLAANLTVDLDNGKVQGTTITTPSGREIYAWRHIPFAEPPVGELRFKAPQPPKPWTGVLDASKDSPACIYSGTYPNDPEPTYGHSEDCLYVNVYSPVEPNSSLSLPVMFWIYGGGFSSGTASFNFYDPTPLVLEDVIVVSFNYRLGVYGFLSTGNEMIPGNSGLKDQLAALQWTHDNVASFGGNPQDITIFGESVGAVSVGYHLLSPLSQGLFSGAIMESGTPLLAFVNNSPETNAVGLAMSLNSSITENSSLETVIGALQSVSADDISKAASNFSFGITIESTENNPTPFITTLAVYESLEAGNFTKVPTILGHNSAEEIVAIGDEESGKKTAAYYDSNVSLLFPGTMHLKEGVSKEEVAAEVKRAYVGNGTFVDDLGVLVNWLTDNTFRRQTIKHAMLQSNYTDVWTYKFSFVGTTSNKWPQIPGCGQVAHSDELSYLFNISTKPMETEDDFAARAKFVKLWTNFAKTKNPTPTQDDTILGDLIWTKFDTTTLSYLDIDSEPVVMTKMGEEKTAFWDNLWETYSYRPYNSF